MSNFNFRLYGEQVYGLLSGYFNDYISPEINKEQFLTMFKEGKLIYDNIKIKQKFNIYPQICINNLNIQNICLYIPDENEHLKVHLKDVSCEMIISNISENQIKEILINQRKNLIDSFIKSSFDKILQKTQSKSFLDNIIEKLVNQALNGINIVINNLKLKIKCMNSTFLFSINDFILDENGKIIFNKISLFYEENSINYCVIPNFDINIAFKNNNANNNNNNPPNLLQMNMSDFSFELNQKIYFGIMNLLNCFLDSYYRRLYFKYKTLIQFHQIKNNNNEKKNYRSLWLYAIRTIIKLQKYVGYDKRYIFNLLNSTQEKIIKKYFKYLKDNNNNSNESNDINLLYLNEINILKGSKETVNQKVLDDKKGSSLTKAFSFFFGGGGNEAPELTEEETECLNNIYTDEYIINYLDNYDKINNDGNIIINKIKKIFSNVIIYIKIQKLELVLLNQNSSKKCDFYINNINIELCHRFENYDYNIYIYDICINQNMSIFSNKRSYNEPMIKFCKNKKSIELAFAFNNIEFNENDFVYLLSFLYSIETPPKTYLFKPEKNIYNKNTNNLVTNIDSNSNINTNNILKDFRISHIPSLTLLCQGNKININFYDFLLTETYFCFTLNIKDSFGEIFPDYTFMINTIKENNTYKFHLNMPIKFILSKDSSKFFFLLYLKLQKVKEENKNGNNNVSLNKNDQLFRFKYTSYIKLDVEDIKQIGFDFLIDKTEIEIYEEKCKSNLLINNFSVKYENKKININLGKILLSTNKYSTIILYLFTFESPDYKEYEKLLSMLNNNNNSLNQNNNKDNDNDTDNQEINNIAIVESFDYVNVIEDLFDSFNLNLKLFDFIYKADNNITELNIKNITAEKNGKMFNISILKCEATLNMLTPVKSTTTLSKANKEDKATILNIKEKVLIDISLATGIIHIKINNPIADINMPILQALDESYMFLIEQINLDIILCKLILEIINMKIIFKEFNYIIENIIVKNFTEVTYDTIFIKTKNIIMRNKTIDIIKEKGIDIEYQFKSSTENVITFKSNDLNINITQSDLYFLILSLKERKSDNYSKDKGKESIISLTNNTTSTNYIDNNFIDNNFTSDILNAINSNFKADINTNNIFDGIFMNNNNNNQNNNTGNNNENQKIQSDEESIINNTAVLNTYFNEDNSPFNLINNNSNNNNNNSDNKSNNKIKKKLVFELKTNAIIPCINLCLCLNEDDDYKKISEFSITSSSFKINSKTILENETNKNSEIDFSIYLGQLLLKYFDNNNNEIIMLNFEKDDKKNENKYSHQIEITYSKNEIKININKNEVIVRADSFLALYYYFKGSLPLDEIMDNLYQVENINKAQQIQVNFNDSKFQLQTSFDGNENLHLDISSFVILYNSFEDGVFPYGNIFITLNTISTTFISKNHSRKLFYTKNDFLYFQIDNSKLKTNLEVRVGTLIINLSYSDIISFLRAYLLNKTFYNNEKRLSNDKFLKNLELCNKYNNLDKTNKNTIQTDSGKIIPLENKVKEYLGNFIFEKLDITLIDNSTGSYYPFINLVLNELKIKYTKKLLDSSLALILYSYNYISRVWEPIIEKLPLSLKYLEQDDATKSHRFIFDIDQILVNLSDMSISFTLVSLNNWIQKYILAQKAFKESKMTIVGNNLIQFQSESSINNITKITNNKVINYTGMNLIIKYANNEFNLKPNEEIALDYINKWEIKQYGPKQIILIYDNSIRMNIPIEKIITLNHNIDNNFFLVSDNILSKDRQINITIYSPIIFKNKSIYSLQVKLENSEIGDKIINFEPESIFGIPLSYYNKKTKFSFIIINSKSSNTQSNNNKSHKNDAFSNSYNLSEIVTTESHERYRKYIRLPNRKILLMKMKRQIGQLRTILITCEYSIINCLPCDIFVETAERGLMVEKCSQQFIDFYAGSGLEMIIKIFANDEYFYTKKKKLFEIQPKKEGNFLKFRNQSNTQSFRLTLNFKVSQNEKALIIYAESILHNNSGVLFDIKSKNKNKSKKTKTQLCFKINDNLFLISSKISNSVKDSYFMLINNLFQSKKIKLQEIMEASPYFRLIMTSVNINDKAHDYILELLIKRRMSYLYVENNPNFKENIMSIIYCILPICRITNLLKNKNFIVQDAIDKSKIMLIPPMNQIDFNFFNRGAKTKLIFGISELKNVNSYQMSTNEFTFINYGIFTFCIGKTIFNLEIRESSSDGIIDIFIVETNLENARIIVENLTDISLTVYQVGFEKFQQIINVQDKQILRIYDQNDPKFIFEIGNKASTFEFTSFEEEQSENRINKNIIFVKESNGIKMNLKFYKIDVFNQFKSKISTVYFNFKINKIFISMIGDNEDKNKRLDDYQRNEIMLFYLNGFNCSINWEQNLGLLGKDIITFNIALDKLELYNQLTNQGGKFSLVFSNIGSPFVFLLTEMFYFKNGKVAKINKFEFIVQKIALYIDPQFINEILNFFQNIIYRMKITNFNVDSVFLTQNNTMEEIEEDVYKTNNILCYGSNFDLPQLKIDFEITSFGLEQLLKQKLGCSFFFVWLANGLCGRKTSINAAKGNIPSFTGKINGIIKKIYWYYKGKILGEITSIGIKGFFGNFTKIFNFIGNDKFSKDANKRIRLPRAFYDKYKCFKSYNEIDSIYFEKIESKYSFLMKKLCYKNIIKGIKRIFLFTDSCLLIFREDDLEIIEQIKYIIIKDTKEEKNNILINYNQKVDGRNTYKINCEDKVICHKVNKILLEELDKITDTNY